MLALFLLLHSVSVFRQTSVPAPPSPLNRNRPIPLWLKPLVPVLQEDWFFSLGVPHPVSGEGGVFPRHPFASEAGDEVPRPPRCSGRLCSAPPTAGKLASRPQKALGCWVLRALA